MGYKTILAKGEASRVGAEQGEARPEAARRKAGQAWEGEVQAGSMFNYF